MDSATKTLRQTFSHMEVFSAAVPNCPKCAKPMMPRAAHQPGGGQYGFWGCLAFPACLGTRPLR